jgi:hypothetical protein
VWTKPWLVGNELQSDSAGARTRPLAAVRIAGRDRWLIGIEVRPMLSEAMLGLGVDQREAVDEPSGTLRVEQQTSASRR